MAVAANLVDVCARQADIGQDMVAEGVELLVRLTDFALFAPGIKNLEHVSLQFRCAASKADEIERPHLFARDFEAIRSRIAASPYALLAFPKSHHRDGWAR